MSSPGRRGRLPGLAATPIVLDEMDIAAEWQPRVSDGDAVGRRHGAWQRSAGRPATC